MTIRRYKAILNDNGDYIMLKVASDTVEQGYKIASDKLKFKYGDASAFVQLKYDGETEIKKRL